MTTPGGQQLTEAHRLAQSRLAVQATAEMTQLWRLLQPDRIDETRDAWVRAVTSPLEALRGRSVSLAEVYQRAFQLGEIGTLDGYPQTLEIDANRRALTISMDVTGPIAAKKAIAISPSLEQAMATAFTRAAGAASRYVLNGGREYIAQSILRNPRSQGYVRITTGRPCYFCAMLASRGAVFKQQSFDLSDARFAGGGDAKVHDHCTCQIASVYQRDEPLTERQAEWDAIWHTAGGTINDFRRAYDAG